MKKQRQTSKREGVNLATVAQAVEKMNLKFEKKFDRLEHIIKQLALAVKTGFDEVDGRFKKVETRIDAIEPKIVAIESKVGTIETNVAHIGASTVTKDYLDEKLFDVKGDMTALTRKEDRKVISVVTLLEKKKVFTRHEPDSILSLEPFTR